jgi:arginine decarboxylase
MRDQSDQPLLQSLLAYLRLEQTSFHVPGHKGGLAAPSSLQDALGLGPFRLDVTEVGLLDSLQHPIAEMRDAMTLASLAFGADRTWFLVNGSTVGVHAMLLAVLTENEEVLISRDCHLSAIGGMILCGSRPQYLFPTWDVDWHLFLPAQASNIVDALGLRPSVAAVFLTSPSYFGIASELGAVGRISSDRGLPIMVDEAHGAHFAFHSAFPKTAMASRVDLSVQSAHKTLTSLTQSALLHWKRGRVEEEKVRAALDILQTSSPSYLLTASLDATRWQMANEGTKLWHSTIELAEEAREQVNRINGLRCLKPNDLQDRGFTLDPTKLLVDVCRLGIDGFQAARILQASGVDVELADPWHVLAVFSIADTPDSSKRLLVALEKLSDFVPNPGSRFDSSSLPPPPVPGSFFTPRQAFFSPCDRVRLSESRGRIVARSLAPFPPGIPVLVPGEMIDTDTIEYLRLWQQLGARILGLEGEEFWIKVVH